MTTGQSWPLDHCVKNMTSTMLVMNLRLLIPMAPMVEYAQVQTSGHSTRMNWSSTRKGESYLKEIP